MTLKTVAAAGRLMLVVGLMAMTAACATVVGGTSQDVLIESEPRGAECRLDRLGSSIGLVRPTPGRINVSRSKDSVIVSCNLDGYEQSNEVLVSSFTGATLGNILIGGLVGVAIDAASGANNKYPDRVMIVLTPSVFPTDEARDAHYAGIRQRIETGANAEIALINSRCSSTNRELCNVDVKNLTDARDKALADLDKRRLAARVVPGAAMPVSSATSSAPARYADGSFVLPSVAAAQAAAPAPAVVPVAAQPAAPAPAPPATPQSFEGKWVGKVGEFDVEMNINGSTGKFTANCHRFQVPTSVDFQLSPDGSYRFYLRPLGVSGSGSERRDVIGKLPDMSISTNFTCAGGTGTLRKL